MDSLQIATGITKCDDYYKLRQYPHERLHGYIVILYLTTELNGTEMVILSTEKHWRFNECK